MMWLTIVEGVVLGWSVAWPPGPINAEMLRRGLQGRRRSSMAVGVGAVSGDFCWALLVVCGVGWLGQRPWFRWGLTAISGILLCYLGAKYLRGAWKSWRSATSAAIQIPMAADRARTGFLLGLGLALSSPWNIGFWLAVLGQRAMGDNSLNTALLFAGAVMVGALVWTIFFNMVIALGARFVNPWWHVVTQGLTGTLMWGFALRLCFRIAQG